MSQLKLSEQTQKDIKEILTRAGRDLCTVMDIAVIDHLRVSLDINFDVGPGKAMGVKYSAFKFEKAEVVYDEDPRRKD